MRNSYSYGSYRGRSRLRGFLKGFVAVLAVVLVLLAVAYFLLREHIVYTDNGFYFDFSAPAQTDDVPAPDGGAPDSQTGGDGAANDDGDIGDVIVEPGPAADTSAYFKALLLEPSALTDGTAAAQVADAGCNAALFDMKPDSGYLNYVSAVSLAVRSGVNPENGDGLNDAIAALNDSGLYTIARVSCFADQRVADYNYSIALTDGGARWADDDGIYWLNPYYNTVQGYLVSICAELAALGFDEILLDHCAYPDSGIAVPGGYSPSVLVDMLYAQISAALAEYDVTLSLVTDEATLADGENEVSGQSAALLARYADRVYVPCDGASLPALGASLTDEGFSVTDTSLVALCAELPKTITYSFALYHIN